MNNEREQSLNGENRLRRTKRALVLTFVLFCLLGCSDRTDATNDASRDLFEPDANNDAALTEPIITRTEPEMCDRFRPTPTTDGAAFTIECTEHTDCTDGENGRCTVVAATLSEPYTTCTYDGCFTDSECGDDTVCSCGRDENVEALFRRADQNACVASNCAVDADCAPFRCAPDRGECGFDRIEGYFCTTANDECWSDADCPLSASDSTRRIPCTFARDESRWVCRSANCDDG